MATGLLTEILKRLAASMGEMPSANSPALAAGMSAGMGARPVTPPPATGAAPPTMQPTGTMPPPTPAQGQGGPRGLMDFLMAPRRNADAAAQSQNRFRDVQTQAMQQEMAAAQEAAQAQAQGRKTAMGELEGSGGLPLPSMTPGYGEGMLYNEGIPQPTRALMRGMKDVDPMKALEMGAGALTPRYENVGGTMLELGPQGARPAYTPPPDLPEGFRPREGGAPGMELDPDFLAGKQRLAEATRAPAAAAAGEQENWGQPVTEAGPDGKPIQVRYGNRGGRQVVEGATPRPQNRAVGPKMINDLMKVGTNMENLGRIKDTAKPEFFGNWLTGGLENTILKMKPGGDPSGQAQWWQDYQSYVNVVRNQLFGAALTPGEQAEFQKAMVTTKMSAEEAAKNLQRQYEISSRAAKRQATAYITQGYDRDAIEGALGFTVDDVNSVDTSGATQGAPGQQRSAPQAQPQAQVQVGTRATGPNGAVIEWDGTKWVQAKR